MSPAAIKKLLAEYSSDYKMSKDVANSESLKEAARIEAGMENFLKQGGFKAFTTTFEYLHGLKQLPGLAVQRLMARGYGFGAEGDWKTAALIRSMKVMAQGLKGGTSFMEDYTYHFNPEGMRVLGAHMLEVCPSIAMGKPTVEIHQLSIGGKADPARLVFKTAPGKAVYNAVALEEIARTAFYTELLGNKEQVDEFLLEKHFGRKHGRDAYYGQKNKNN